MSAPTKQPPAALVMRPEFVRVPRPGTTEPYTGLKRTQICDLIKDGKVASIVLRNEGRSRGVRLIRLSSLIDYIEREGEPA